MVQSLDHFRYPFFMGIAGSGMSALAQYLNGIGKNVSGSDRYFGEGEAADTREKLERENIRCYLQNGEGITEHTDLIIASTAVEESVPEMQFARQKNIPVIRRSELLALIAQSRKTIAIGGTSGKSTTTAMLFDILEYAGMEPSIISGAGLVHLIEQGKIGNAKVGKGEWLVMEADESDGSIIQYKPGIGVLLNVDKDHQEIGELMEIFRQFRRNSHQFIVNRSNPLARELSQDLQNDFSADEKDLAGYMAGNFIQTGFNISFTINKTPFSLDCIGKHNMENALAAATVAAMTGVNLETSAAALKNYKGIYRRMQVYGKKNNVWLIDDYAHNPAKCAAAIRACHPLAKKIIAWFQPHGYKPTKFLRSEFVQEIAAALRPADEIWMSEIFYAGGTAVKDISSADLVQDINQKGSHAYFVEDRNKFLEEARKHFTEDCVILLMAARDPSLENFARSVWDAL
jgi:UDP-N-acetylmuramate--alanine ligase